MNELRLLRRIVDTELTASSPMVRDDGFLEREALWEAPLPGRMRLLWRGPLNDPGTVVSAVGSAAPAKRAPPAGFNYRIYGRSRTANRASRLQLLDIGMAKTLANLRRRLREKRNSLTGKWRDLQVSVSVLTGVPRPTIRDPTGRTAGQIQPVDMKILHCHELLAQYAARNRLARVRNYRPGSWPFDDFEEMLRASLDD